MRPDLQELEITLGELKRLTGFNWQRYQKSKRVYQLRPFMPSWFSLQYLLGMMGSFFGLVAFHALFISPDGPDLSDGGDLFGVILLALMAMLCFGGIILIGNEYNKTNVFGKEINQYYQLILNINTLDQLEAVGNPVKLNEREKVLEALRINRENLVRALQTERILRENPQFRPEQFNIDLSDLRSLQATEKATEYGRFLDEALQIGVSVQTEMRKLENKRLGL
jgi:hypothetical protein